MAAPRAPESALAVGMRPAGSRNFSGTRPAENLGGPLFADASNNAKKLRLKTGCTVEQFELSSTPFNYPLMLRTFTALRRYRQLLMCSENNRIDRDPGRF